MPYTIRANPSLDFITYVDQSINKINELSELIRRRSYIENEGYRNIDFLERMIMTNITFAEKLRSAIEEGDFLYTAKELKNLSIHIQSNCVPYIRDELRDDLPRVDEVLSDAFRSLKAAETILEDRVGIRDEVTRGKTDIPPEKPAPIRVKIENNKLVLENIKQHVGPIDFESADRIRQSILSNLIDAINDLSEESNIDRRVVRSFVNLKRSLSQPLAASSIESIGINVQLATSLISVVRDEVNNLTLINLDHILNSTSILLAQFQDWGKFLAESAKIDVRSIDGNLLVRTTEELANELSQHGDVVDQEIVARLRDMTSPVISEILSSDTVVPALIPSLSNLLGTISSLAVDVSTSLNISSISEIKLAAGVVLLLLCNKIITKFFPLFATFKPLSFTMSIVDFSAKYFSPLAALLS